MKTHDYRCNSTNPSFRQHQLQKTLPQNAPYSFPEMNALFHRHCFNAAGRLKLKAQSPGVLSKVIPRVRQLFERVPCGTAALADDARFDYFTRQVRFVSSCDTTLVSYERMPALSIRDWVVVMSLRNVHFVTCARPLQRWLLKKRQKMRGRVSIQKSRLWSKSQRKPQNIF